MSDHPSAGLVVRATKPREVGIVRSLVVACIEQSPYYSDLFKAREIARYNRLFLRTLIARDPEFVRLAEWRGEPVGFLINVPEDGVLWSSWLYVKPSAKASAAALTLIRKTWAHFDSGRFDKVCCFVRPDNETALKIFQRLGFQQTALLEKHLLGQDVILLERQFARQCKSYPPPMKFGVVQKIMLRLAAALGV